MGQKVTVWLVSPQGVASDPVTTDTRTLTDAQAEVVDRVNAEFDALVAAGRVITVQSVQSVQKTYQIDDASRSDITGAGALALASIALNGTWPAGFYWIAADNSHQPMAAADCVAFAQSVGAYYTGLVVTCRALKDASAALTTVAQCDAFDVTQGWPSNP